MAKSSVKHGYQRILPRLIRRFPGNSAEATIVKYLVDYTGPVKMKKRIDYNYHDDEPGDNTVNVKVRVNSTYK